MNNLYVNIALFLVSAVCLNNIGIAQITRGATPGEIYISTDWYMDEYGQVHYAILHSTDNGETVSLKYENTENTPPGEMRVGTVLGDATPGALYNKGNNELWVSFDYGKSWEYRDGPFSMLYYFSGFANGEIFKTWTNEALWQVELYRSENHGLSFELINESIEVGLLDVGHFEGEVFGLSGSAGIGYELNFSIDYGEYFTETPIDSTVAFWSISGHYPQISRGTEPGELYLTSWWPGDYYKIFHSIDTGYTWTEQFESETINVYFWRVKYTAGREPGSFYVMRSRINPAGDHTWLYIDYSNDYGKTFTTYFHDLDSTITGIRDFELDSIKLSNYPNPFSGHTTFSFNIPAKSKNPKLNIYDMYGILIRQLSIYRKKTQV